jgi:hypothetical protein
LKHAAQLCSATPFTLAWRTGELKGVIGNC